jgi:hypothetical protein
LLLGFLLALVDLLDDVDSSGTQLIVLEAKGISLFFRSVFFSPVKRIISNSSEVLCHRFRIFVTGHVSPECGWKIVSEV